MNESKGLHVVYSDLNSKAYLTPFVIVTNVDEAVQRILLVFATPKLTRWKRPQFGTLVGQYLFDPMDELTSEKIRNELEDTTTDPENDLMDIIFTKIEVIPDYANQQYFISLNIEIPNLQDTKVLEFALISGA
jgi:hypothetical protein